MSRHQACLMRRMRGFGCYWRLVGGHDIGCFLHLTSPTYESCEGATGAVACLPPQQLSFQTKIFSSVPLLGLRCGRACAMRAALSGL